MDGKSLDELGRYHGNRDDGKGGWSEHARVGSYEPNAWELYDMHGNVWEWCLDWYQSGLGESEVTDPAGAAGGSYRVLRGGDWSYDAVYCRSAYRSYGNPSYNYCDGDSGFRLSLP